MKNSNLPVKIVPISFVQSFLPKSERKYSKTEYGLI